MLTIAMPAGQRFSVAVILLLCWLLVGLGGPAYAVDISRLTEKAQQGDVAAQVRLARLLLRGKEVAKDTKRARFWYQRAASQGDANGQFGLGYLYEHGIGVSRDYGQAFHWYALAAEQGVARAQRPLGKFYELGLGVAKDPRQAAYWYQKAAAQGNLRAMVNLGILYESGTGVARDYGQAARWYERSARKGYPRGQYHLGRLYEQGLGVEKDRQLALKWYRKSAAAGYSRAKKRLKSGVARPPEERNSPGEKPRTTQKTIDRQGEVASLSLPDNRQELSAPAQSLPRRPLPRPDSSAPESGDNEAALWYQPEAGDLERGLAERYFYQANELVRAGKYALALQKYEQALELEPDNANTLENMAITQAKMGRLKEGMNTMGLAIALDPMDAGKHFSQGIIYHAMGKEDAALDQYRQTLAINATLPGVYYNIAVIHAGRGSYPLAWKALQMATAFGYDISELRDELARVSDQQTFSWPQPTDGWYLRRIVAASRQDAETARRRLLAGEKFKVVASSMSSRPDPHGGYMGFVKRSEVSPTVRGVLEKLGPFAISTVVQGPDGFSIFQHLALFPELLTRQKIAATRSP